MSSARSAPHHANYVISHKKKTLNSTIILIAFFHLVLLAKYLGHYDFVQLVYRARRPVALVFTVICIKSNTGGVKISQSISDNTEEFSCNTQNLHKNESKRKIAYKRAALFVIFTGFW